MKTSKTPKTTKPAAKRTPAKTVQKYPNKGLQDLVAQGQVVHDLPQDANVIAAKPPAAAVVELSIQDIQNFKNILEVVAQRGVFRAEEMTLVGETYTRLTTFLAANQNG